MDRRKFLAGTVAGTAAVGTTGMGGAVIGSGTSGGTVDRAATTARRTDVVVVGAGFAGLAAATELRARGLDMVVLEAGGRVGGRVLDRSIGGGDVVEMGGEWAGPGQDRVLGLARSLGVRTFRTPSTGRSVLLDGRLRVPYEGDLPPLGGASLAALTGVLATTSRLARRLSGPSPAWETEAGRALDRQSAAGWLDTNCTDARARRFLELAILAVLGTDATDVSALDLVGLATIGGSDDLTGALFDAQTIRFVGGPQQLARGLARRLDGRVRLRHPVTRIAWDEDGVEVTTDNRRVFRARSAIVTLPTPLTARIAYDPPLPAWRDQLTQRQGLGSVIKVNVVYPTPFWRDAGLNGTALALEGAFRPIADNSPPHGHRGVLVGFFEGSEGRPFYDDPAARRAVVLDTLVQAFGRRAAHPQLIAERNWAADPWIRGAYGTYNPPGFLAQFGGDLGRPVGPIAWASADLAETWPGYIDGAIESGRSVARAVADALRR